MPAIFRDLTAELKRSGKGHLEQQVVGLVPLYSIESGDRGTGFPQVMVARMKALMYPQFSFCPKEDSGLPNPSVARIDRLSLVRPIHPAYQPTNKALSEEGFAVFSGLISLFLNLGMADAELAEFNALRELVLEALPPSAKADQK
jgi:hypothetical protein